jgi:uncharacterized protein YbbC (DUF1343 family)
MIKTYAYILLLFFGALFYGCKNKVEARSLDLASYEVKQKEEKVIVPGAERIALYYPLLKSKKVACVVNHTSMIKELHLVDSLLKMKVEVKKVFAPEHGFRGDKSDGETVENFIDKRTGLPIISLYGKHKKPTEEDLEDVDIVVFDIQDVGARFYTYLSTMHYVMEACAELNIPIIVLDRPNPHLDYIDGPVLEKNFTTFVGLHPVPVVYGMTIGEYANMINGEGWLGNKVKADLTVVPINNFSRGDYYSIPIKPSPNLPNMRSILLYPSLCFFEGTTISVGRGTSDQFQVLGNPELSDKGFSFIPKPNEGSKYPPHENKMCFGEDLTDLTIGSLKDKNRIDLSWLLSYYKDCSNSEIDFFVETNHFDRLAGTDKLKKQISAGLTETQIRDSWKSGLEDFSLIRNKYLIYPPQDNN